MFDFSKFISFEGLFTVYLGVMFIDRVFFKDKMKDNRQWLLPILSIVIGIVAAFFYYEPLDNLKGRYTFFMEGFKLGCITTVTYNIAKEMFYKKILSVLEANETLEEVNV